MVEIGKIIKHQLSINKMSVSEFASKINTNRNNVYNIFTRNSIDTELLLKISIILNHDFFQYFKPLGENISSGEGEVYVLPDKEWFLKQFKLLNKKLDQLKI